MARSGWRPVTTSKTDGRIDRPVRGGDRLHLCADRHHLLEAPWGERFWEAGRVYALARRSIMLKAGTDEADLPRRLEQPYMATAGRHM
jgi:hypothetical protein